MSNRRDTGWGRWYPANREYRPPRYRSSSPEYSPDRRRIKSTRLLSVYPLKQQEPFANSDEFSANELDKIDIKRLGHLAEEYNRFLPFCKDRGIEDKESNVVRRGYGIEQSIRDIERIVEEARMKVKYVYPWAMGWLEPCGCHVESNTDCIYFCSNLNCFRHLLILCPLLLGIDAMSWNIS